MKRFCHFVISLGVFAFGACVAGATQTASPPSPIPEPASPLCKPSASRLCKPPRIQVALNDVPRCVRKLGTISIVDGNDSAGWTQYSLESPQKLLRVLVQRSGCFNVVERGSGLAAAQSEREIGGNLGPQRSSNVGRGQVKVADYVMVAEVQGAKLNSSGVARLPGVIGGHIGGLIGGFGSRKVEAITVLSLTNVRTTETIAVEDGHATKKSLSSGVGGAGGLLGGGAAAVGGGYDNTDIGRMVTLAFIQAYSKLVKDVELVQPGAVSATKAAPAKTFIVQKPVPIRAAASAAGRVLRTLPSGSIVYPTGEKNGLWWEVADENDNVGWVLKASLAPSN